MTQVQIKSAEAVSLFVCMAVLTDLSMMIYKVPGICPYIKSLTVVQ
ncbi:hypothetical protein [Phascolarctobacterium faecium]